MIVLSEEARQELEQYFADKEKTPIRIYLAPGGCGGPRLGLALDEPGDDDTTVEDHGITLCINKDLLEQVEGVTIRMTPMGFLVIPKKEFPEVEGGSCGSCGGGCSGCH